VRIGHYDDSNKTPDGSCCTGLLHSADDFRDPHRQASTDRVRSHANSSGSTRALRRAGRAVPVQATGKIMSSRSNVAAQIRSLIFNGRPSLRRKPRTGGSERIALASSASITARTLSPQCSAFFGPRANSTL
jgi:hypothetical protein